MERYILNAAGEPVAEPSLMKWAMWIEEHRLECIVKQEWIGNVRVSTVFLHLDHNWGDGPPVLWETMTFSNRPEFDRACDRCPGGREQAEAMHEQVCARVREALKTKSC